MIVERRCYADKQFGRYSEDNRSPALRVKEPFGGGELLILDTLIFDEGQITCPTNGLNPQWGGCAIPCPGTLEERW